MCQKHFACAGVRVYRDDVTFSDLCAGLWGENSSHVSVFFVWHIAQDFGVSARILAYQVRLEYVWRISQDFGISVHNFVPPSTSDRMGTAVPNSGVFSSGTCAFPSVS